MYETFPFRFGNCANSAMPSCALDCATRAAAICTSRFAPATRCTSATSFGSSNSVHHSTSTGSRIRRAEGPGRDLHDLLPRAGEPGVRRRPFRLLKVRADGAADQGRQWHSRNPDKKPPASPAGLVRHDLSGISRAWQVSEFPSSGCSGGRRAWQPIGSRAFRPPPMIPTTCCHCLCLHH